MRNCYKFLILITFMILLTGCDSWEDIYEKHKDVLDKGVTCSYKYVRSEMVDCNKKEDPLDCSEYVAPIITLSANAKGFYVNDDKVESNSVTIGDHTVYVDTFDYDKFLNDYKQSGACPTTISYGFKDIYHFEYQLYYHNNQDAEKHLYEYIEPYGPPAPEWDDFIKENLEEAGKLDDTTGNQNEENTEEQEIFDDSCKSARAISCKNYDVLDYWGHTIYVQLGRQKTTSNEIREYFVVSYVESLEGSDVVYKDTYTGDSESLATVLAKYNEYPEQYFYVSSDDMIEVFPGENNYADTIYLNYYGEGGIGDFYIYEIVTKPTEGENDQFEGSISSDADDVDSSKVELGKVTCETLFQDSNGNPNSTHKLLSTTLKFMQYLGIILAFVLSIIDFIKVVPTQDKDALRKSTMKAVTRFGIAILIFFVPIILDFVLELIGFNSSTCGLL